MRFLRMLTNALLAGALGGSYLTVLVLQLNPHVPLLSETTLRWFATLGLFYGVQFAVLFYLLMVARDFFTLDTLSPGWASVRVLAWLAAALSAGTAILMWLNVSGFELALGESAHRRMTAGAAAASVSSLVLLGIAIAHYSWGRRGSRVGAALFVIAAFGSLALPLAARGPAVEPAPQLTGSATMHPEPTGRRVVMLLLDGASLDYIWPRAAEGRLPNFWRLLETGATLDLATVRPTGPGPVWASVATGMYPDKTGVRGGATYSAWNASRPMYLLPDYCFSHALVQLGVLRQHAISSSAWQARPIWDILSHAGLPVGIVRWPLTYPVPTVDGFVVSDRYHDAIDSMRDLDGSAAFPRELASTIRTSFTALAANDADPAVVLAATSGASASGPEASSARRDAAYSRVWRDLRARMDVRFAALRYEGLDTIGHLYIADTQPGAVADTTNQERRRHAQNVDRYYSFIDGEIGNVIASLAPDDLLLVISGFGMQRLHPVKQILGRIMGDRDTTGTHDRAPDGFLLAYGSDVEHGRPPRGSIVDVVPTVLYYLGLPVGRDMDGHARSDIFTRDFTAERPISFIPSYSR